MSAYEFIFIHNGQRTAHEIIAPDAIGATCIGIRLISAATGPLRITCKPLRKPV
ncbi:MAG: hypothetical protein WC742_12465 [Gallionellaceae bacterium]|jgi:hypothetical protein